jgi:hypothetical protein
MRHWPATRWSPHRSGSVAAGTRRTPTPRCRRRAPRCGSASSPTASARRRHHQPRTAWVAASCPAGRELLNSQIQIRARCHNGVVADLRAALAEVAAAGLAGAIDVANANTYGGCHNPRFNRISAQSGSLSRHAWAMALDFNTVTNCQGCVPRMDCRVVHDLPQARVRVGRQLPAPGRDALRVGRRASRPARRTRRRTAPNPVSATTSGIPNRATRSDLLFADETLAVRSSTTTPTADVGR